MWASAVDMKYEQPAKLDAWLYVDEITHRTLNDYTVMLCMLRSATMGMKSAPNRAVLDAVSARLEAAANAHKVLSPQRGSPVCRLDDDLERLCVSLASSILAGREIRLNLACEQISLSARRSWQISLIVSELVTNAVKHAFSSSAQGAIDVNVRLVDGHIHAVVADNGKAASGAAPGRGSSIVDALARDLDGAIARRFTNQGSTVLLRIPVSDRDIAPSGATIV